jgi:hypothetical protein
VTATETSRVVETVETYYLRQDWQGSKMFSRTGGWSEEADARAALAEYEAHGWDNEMTMYVERITKTTTTTVERIDP